MSEENAAPESAPESTGDWKSSLPEPLRDAPWIGKADSLEAAVGQLQDAAQYLGNAIRIPSEDAGEADVAAFKEKLLSRDHIGLMPKPTDDGSTKEVLRALGMPEKPEQYDVTGIDHAPDGEELGRLRAMAHEAGMTTSQFRKWVGEQSSANYTAQEQIEHQRNEALKELRGEWGFAYDDKVVNALKAMEATGAPDYVIDMVKNGEADSKVLRWGAALYDQLSDAAPQGSIQGKQAVQKLTPAEAEARLSEIERRIFDKATPKDQLPMLTEKRIALMQDLVGRRA